MTTYTKSGREIRKIKKENTLEHALDKIAQNEIKISDILDKVLTLVNVAMEKATSDDDKLIMAKLTAAISGIVQLQSKTQEVQVDLAGIPALLEGVNNVVNGGKLANNMERLADIAQANGDGKFKVNIDRDNKGLARSMEIIKIKSN